MMHFDRTFLVFGPRLVLLKKPYTFCKEPNIFRKEPYIFRKSSIKSAKSAMYGSMSLSMEWQYVTDYGGCVTVLTRIFLVYGLPLVSLKGPQIFWKEPYIFQKKL